MSANHVAIKNDPRWHAARAACLERDGATCQACGSTEQPEADHKQPLQLGGDPFDLANLQTLCKPCNVRKGTTPLVAEQVTWISDRWPELLIMINNDDAPIMINNAAPAPFF